jgi:hypothetical protein
MPSEKESQQHHRNFFGSIKAPIAACKKRLARDKGSLAEFAPAGANKIKIIF